MATARLALALALAALPADALPAPVGRGKVKPPANFVAPTPRPLTVTRPGDQAFGLLTASAALGLRIGSGVFTLGWTPRLLFGDDAAKVGPGTDVYAFRFGPIAFRDTAPLLEKAPRPAVPPILFENEASPGCRQVREVAILLDIPLELRPCPGMDGEFAQQLRVFAPNAKVPYMIDTNTGKELSDAEEIIDYLVRQYGPELSEYDLKSLWPFRGPFAIVTAVFASLMRGFAGSRRAEGARPDNEQMEPLELWGYEPSPFVRPVREKLCELCLPHVVVPTARGSANRDRLTAMTKTQFQVPFLKDPNTGVQMFESPDILDYLEAVYTTKSKSKS